MGDFAYPCRHASAGLTRDINAKSFMKNAAQQGLRGMKPS
jgi:hypothetical protein